MIGSKKLDRYNDDFALYVPSAGSRYADTNFTGVGVIDDSLDWSISFFCYRETRGTGILWDNRGGVASNQPKGVELIFDDSNPNYSFRFRTGLGSSQTDYFFISDYKIGYIYHTVLTFNSTTKDLKHYINGVNVETLNTTGDNPIDCTTVTYSRFLSFSGSYAGALKQCFIRDFSVYSKELNPQEINYIYKTNVPPVSSYNNVENYYPLNQVPYDSGGNYFMNDVSKQYNPLATTNDVPLTGWTADELGLGVGGLPASTTYRGWESKTNYIPIEDYTKGLNFNSAKAQYLEVTGLEAFNKDDGYTFLIGVKKQADTGQQSMFSCVGDELFSRYYDIFRRGGGANVNEFQFVSPVTSGSPTSSSNVFTGIDSTNNNFLSYFVGNNQMYNPYSNTRIRRIIDVNVQQDYQVGIGDPFLGFGFDEITNPKFQIGARNGSNALNGKITFLTIIKGVITKEEEKKIFNNGLYRSPYEVLEDTSIIILDVDFLNPFLDGSDVKFTDNSGNCVLTAKGTDWTTLAGVQASID